MNVKQIREKLEKHGITQAELSSMFRVTPSQVSLVLSGSHESKSLLQKIETYVNAIELKLSKINSK